MPGLLALVGGDEFKPTCREMDAALLAATGVARPRVVIVPTAAALENPALAASNGVAYFHGLGAKASAAMILSRADADDPELLRDLAGADLIYLTGGSPGYLLETLKGTSAWATIVGRYRAGGMIVGSSAGAMVMAEAMRGRGGAWVEALGLASELAVLPHRESLSQEQIDSLRRTLEQRLVLLGIDSATGCLGRGDGAWRVLGAGQAVVYAEGKALAYRSAEEFSLAAPKP